MVKRIAWPLVALAVVLAAYLALWPVPIRAVGWVSPSPPGYTGPHSANSKLAGLTLISLGDEVGPEHIVLARDGKLYAAVASGNILRMNRMDPGRRCSSTPAAACSASTSMRVAG